MELQESLAFYLLVGAVVAVAAYLGDDDAAGRRRDWLRTAWIVVSAWLFWPLYVPVLLSARQTTADRPPSVEVACTDDLAAAIYEVEAELDRALSSLGGWAESVLASEGDRIGELRRALAAQAGRIRDMDELLARSKSVDGPTGDGVATSFTAESPDARCSKSRQARLRNLARLADVRNKAYADLTATLAWIGELASMIHLAKFTGAPAARAEELVAQIAAAIEGVSVVTCHESDDADVASAGLSFERRDDASYGKRQGVA